MNRGLEAAVCWLVGLSWIAVAEDVPQPPPIDPFEPRRQSREDAIAGYLEMSDGAVYPGKLFLTRDARLEILDEQSGRRSEVPLSAVQRVACKVKREWMEKEWRFRENANDQKVYTGRAYPARLYVHQVVLRDKRTLEGSLSGIVYVEDDYTGEARRFLLHKRQKGALDASLSSLSYVRCMELGEGAFQRGKELAAERRKPGARRTPKSTR